jgi:undecaprenyl-diphosphatase
MSFTEAVLLGLIQGLTEFLPVSSSGHLVIVQSLLQLREPPLTVDAVLHLGTAAAVVVFFRHELVLLAKSIWRWTTRGEKDRYTALAAYLSIATIPAAVGGFFFERFFSGAFESVLIAGLMLLVTGAVLWLVEGVDPGVKRLDELKMRDSIWVGLAQMLAILPGLSRSGATIAVGLWRGFQREEAARFSFLLSLPVILGAGLYTGLKNGFDLMNLPAILAATAVAGLSGFLAIALLMKAVRERRLRLFSVYCFIVGGLALAFSVLG